MSSANNINESNLLQYSISFIYSRNNIGPRIDPCGPQWRRHGEDWGGHVPPSSLQGQFSNLSKSGKKNGGGGTFVTSVQLFRSNLTV